MTLTPAIRACIVSLLLFVATPVSRTQQVDNAGNDGPQETTVRQKQGLVEYALHGINPTDRNYGACLDDARRVVIQETIDRAYFWSNLLAIALASCLLLFVVHQHRLLQRRECMAAESLTQYRNALARAEAHADDASQRNHELMQALSASSGTNSRSVPTNADNTDRDKPRKGAPVVSASSVSTETKSAAVATAATPAKDPAVATPPLDSRPENQLGLFGADGDFIAKINTLQQQLNLSQERERQLRRQLNESELRIEKEKQKTRSLQA